MARYRLMLLEAPPRWGAALDDLSRALPPGVDAMAFAGLRGRPFVDPVLLGGGDDPAVLEAAASALNDAGLVVCVVDHSTRWIRFVGALRSMLGFTTVKVVSTADALPSRGFGAPSAGHVGRREPALRPARTAVWARLGILGAGLLLPLATAMLASAVLGDALQEDESPRTAAAAGSGGAGRGTAGRERGLAMHAAEGGGGSGAEASAGRGGAALPAEGDGRGDSVELTMDPAAEVPSDGDAPAPAPARPRRTARKAVAAVLAALLGLGVAALAGEAIERATRAKGPRFRRRLRLAAAGVAGVGALIAPLSAWQARAGARPPEPTPVAAPAARPRLEPPPTPTAAGEAGCAGGPFARFLCRSGRPRAAPPLGPRPFASLLAGFRRRAPAGAPDARPPSDAGAAATTPARRGHGARHGHHRRHRDGLAPAPDAATAPTAPSTTAPSTTAPTPTAAAPSSIVAELPAGPDAATPEALEAPAAIAVTAPPAAEREGAEPTPPEEPEAPAPPVVEAPRRRRVATGWLAGWFAVGLALGLMGAPGWRRLGRAEA